MTQKRIQITIETEQLLTIRRRRSLQAWCPECKREVNVISIDEVARIAGMNRQLIGDAIVNRQWHTIKTPDGLVLICLESSRCSDQ
jgi:hypothetical protein